MFGTQQPSNMSHFKSHLSSVQKISKNVSIDDLLKPNAEPVMNRYRSVEPGSFLVKDPSSKHLFSFTKRKSFPLLF